MRIKIDVLTIFPSNISTSAFNKVNSYDVKEVEGWSFIKRTR